MAGWMISTVLFVNSWVIRSLVLLSFTAHVITVFLAGFRRRYAIGVEITILWAVNQLGHWAATYTLGKLALGSTPEELQLVTLWEAFLLLHAGGPDNITAYSLEDNVLSTRQKFAMLFQVIGAVYAVYKNIVVRSGAGLMVWVSVVMFILGIVKYGERAAAMKLANLENMRSSVKAEKKTKETSRRRSLRNVRRPSSWGRHDNEEEALLVAHGLLDITKGAFVDSSIDEHLIPDYVAKRREIFPSRGWEMMYKVVDMELSLMYDILYTKAAMVHTWHGYAIRFVSPVITTAAFLLFWFDSKVGQRMADVLITYILLAGTVLLDIRWLLGAVASTWTYSFLNDRPRLWLHHAFLCSGKWRMLRRLIVCLDPSLILAKEPSSYRKWSGKIGQYNLLHECTRDKHDTTSNYLSSVVKKVASEDQWMEYEYHSWRGIHVSPNIEKKLFDCIWEFMRLAYPVEDGAKEKEEEKKKEKKKKEKAKEEEEKEPVEYHRVEAVRKLEEVLDFLPEFQESILILHIATDVVFLYSEDEQHAASSETKQDMKVIKALSDYMMFLVAVRPGMLPGLKLRSLYDTTLAAMEKLWSEKRSLSCSSTTREKCLADIMFKEQNKTGTQKNGDEWKPGYRTRKWKPENITVLYSLSIALSDGIKLADLLLKCLRVYKIDFPKTDYDSKFTQMFPKLMKILENHEYPKKLAVLLDHIFAEWVRLLINASVKCTRDSHAKQLGRGGELTTIVWNLVEHAGIFRVDRHRK